MIDTSIYLNVFLTIGGLFLGLNLLGILYSKLILVNGINQLSYIPKHKHQPNSFKKHLPLILINLIVMCVVFPAGLYLMSDWIMVSYQNFWIVLLQLIVVLLIDDFYFYIKIEILLNCFYFLFVLKLLYSDLPL